MVSHIRTYGKFRLLNESSVILMKKVIANFIFEIIYLVLGDAVKHSTDYWVFEI